MSAMDISPEAEAVPQVSRDSSGSSDGPMSLELLQVLASTPDALVEAEELYDDDGAKTPAARRARPSYSTGDGDSSDEEDEEEKAEKVAEKFVPFGSVVSASGCSVRATVACAAGLAAAHPGGRGPWRRPWRGPSWRGPLRELRSWPRTLA